MVTNDLVVAGENDVFIDDEPVSTVGMPEGAMGGQFYRRVSFPSQMDNGWMFPLDDGESREEVSSFEGIIVAISYPRALYAEKYDPNNPQGPICSSNDGFIGEIDRGRVEKAATMGFSKPKNDCGRCPYAARGADPKCDPYATLWVLLNGETEPVAVRCPKGSLTPLRLYVNSVGGHAGIWQFVTRFGIGKSENGKYRVATFDAADVPISAKMMKNLEVRRGELIDELSTQGVVAALQENDGQSKSSKDGVSW